MDSELPVIIVGGGQAGLSMSYELTARGIEHLVLERHAIGHAWRNERWDSFCLVTPNWQCQLPGFPYAGDDPNGFMVKDEIVAHVQAYARTVDPPVQTGVTVRGAVPRSEGGFRLETSRGTFRCRHLVVATGGYHTPRVPAFGGALPHRFQHLHACSYRNAGALPPGEILVVGSGQSGCQIAEDLHLSGRTVHLSVGSAPRTARFYRGRDVVEWLDLMGHYDAPIDGQPDPEQTRRKTNHYVTGRDGGRDIDLRQRALEGMRLYGSALGYEGGVLSFIPNLAVSLDAADAAAERIKGTIDAFIAARGISAPDEAPYRAPWRPAREPTRLSVEAISAVIWCTGYAPDFSWVDAPVFERDGLPHHHRGVTDHPGLYFLGLPWLHTWGSGRFSGVGRDASFLSETIAGALSRSRRPHARASH